MAIYKLNDDQGNEYDIGAHAENVKITLEDGSETTLADALGSSTGLGALGDKINSLEDSVTDLKTNTESLTERVEDLETDTTSLTGRVVTLSANIMPLVAQVGSLETNAATLAGQVDVLETNTASLTERIEVLEEKPLNGKYIIFYGDDFTSAYKQKIATAVGGAYTNYATTEGTGCSLTTLEQQLLSQLNLYPGGNCIRIVSCGFDDFFAEDNLRVTPIQTMGDYSNIVAGPTTRTTIYQYLDRVCYLLMGTHFSSNHFNKTYWILPHRMFADGEYGTSQKNITWEDYRNAIKRVCAKWGIEIIDLQEVVPPVAGGLSQNAQHYSKDDVTGDKYAFIQLKDDFYTNLIIPYIVKRIS